MDLLKMLDGTDLGETMRRKNVAFNFFTCPDCGEKYRALQVKHDDGSEHHWPCPKCAEKQRVADEHKVQLMKHDPALIIREKLEDAGVPARYLDYCFGNFPVQEGTFSAYEGARSFIDAEFLDLVLLGPTGLGKTSLAISIIRSALQKGLTARFCKEATLLDEVKSTFSGGRESSEDVKLRYSRYDLLVIDEVGLSSWSAFDAATMTTIIDNRSSSLLKTVFLGNLKADEYSAHFNDQCISRLHQDADFYILTGRDLRYAE